MKKIFLFALLSMSAMSSFSQEKTDWANFPKYEKENARVRKLPAAQRKVVFMGNSITEGWVRTDSAFFTKNGFIGRGIGGQVSSQMLVRFRRDVLELNPQVVVILAGTNDIAQNHGPISLENIFGNIVSMAELARYHGIKVIICSVTPVSDYPWSKGKNPDVKIPELNTMLSNYAKKNKIVYADYFSKMANSSNGLDKDLAEDGVHPTLPAYKIMENIILQKIKPLLK